METTSAFWVWLLASCFCLILSQTMQPKINPSRLLIATVLDYDEDFIIRDTFTLVRSLRLHGGDLNNATFTVCIPLNFDSPSFYEENGLIYNLTALGVEIAFIKQTQSPLQKTLNKFGAFGVFDSHRFDYFLWLDADVVIFDDALKYLSPHTFPGSIDCVPEFYSYMRRYPIYNLTDIVWSKYLPSFHILGEGEITPHGMCNTGVIFFDHLSITKFLTALQTIQNDLFAAKHYVNDRFLDSLLFVIVVNFADIAVNLFSYKMNYLAHFEVEIMEETQTDDIIFAQFLTDTVMYCFRESKISTDNRDVIQDSLLTHDLCRCLYYNKFVPDQSLIVKSINEKLLPYPNCDIMAGYIEPSLPSNRLLPSLLFVANINRFLNYEEIGNKREVELGDERNLFHTDEAFIQSIVNASVQNIQSNCETISSEKIFIRNEKTTEKIQDDDGDNIGINRKPDTRHDLSSNDRFRRPYNIEMTSYNLSCDLIWPPVEGFTYIISSFDDMIEFPVHICCEFYTDIVSRDKNSSSFSGEDTKTRYDDIYKNDSIFIPFIATVSMALRQAQTWENVRLKPPLLFSNHSSIFYQHQLTPYQMNPSESKVPISFCGSMLISQRLPLSKLYAVNNMCLDLTIDIRTPKQVLLKSGLEPKISFAPPFVALMKSIKESKIYYAFDIRGVPQHNEIFVETGTLEFTYLDSRNNSDDFVKCHRNFPWNSAIVDDAAVNKPCPTDNNPTTAVDHQFIHVKAMIFIKSMQASGVISYTYNPSSGSKPYSLPSQLLLSSFLNERKPHNHNHPFGGSGAVLCCDTWKGVHVVINLIRNLNGGTLIIMMNSFPLMLSNLLQRSYNHVPLKNEIPSFDNNFLLLSHLKKLSNYFHRICETEPNYDDRIRSDDDDVFPSYDGYDYSHRLHHLHQGHSVDMKETKRYEYRQKMKQRLRCVIIIAPIYEDKVQAFIRSSNQPQGNDGPRHTLRSNRITYQAGQYFSSRIGKSIAPNSLDFVYIDSYISYNDYLTNLDLWFRTLRMKGFLIGSRYDNQPFENQLNFEVTYKEKKSRSGLRSFVCDVSNRFVSADISFMKCNGNRCSEFLDQRNIRSNRFCYKNHNGFAIAAALNNFSQSENQAAFFTYNENDSAYCRDIRLTESDVHIIFNVTFDSSLRKSLEIIIREYGEGECLPAWIMQRQSTKSFI